MRCGGSKHIFFVISAVITSSSGDAIQREIIYKQHISLYGNTFIQQVVCFMFCDIFEHCGAELTMCFQNFELLNVRSELLRYSQLVETTVSRFVKTFRMPCIRDAGEKMLQTRIDSDVEFPVSNMDFCVKKYIFPRKFSYVSFHPVKPHIFWIPSKNITFLFILFY